MKKSIITLLAVICSVSYGFDWKSTDAAAIADAKKTSSAWFTMHHEIALKYIADPAQFDTWEKIVAEHKAVFDASGIKNRSFDVFLTQSVFNRQMWFKKYNLQAFNECQSADYKINYYLDEKLADISNLERWRGLCNILIDGNIQSPRVAAAINLLFKIDSRIDRDEKIEQYRLIYEKYFCKIGDEQNIAAEKKVWTPIVFRIALKLKSLGVEVVK